MVTNVVMTLLLLAALVWLPYGNTQMFQGLPLWVVIVLAVAAIVIRPKRDDR